MTILWHTGSAPLTNRGHIIHYPTKKTFFSSTFKIWYKYLCPEKEDKIAPKIQEKEDNITHKPHTKEGKQGFNRMIIRESD